MNLLTQEFLSQYESAPEHMNELGAFVFYRTYSRWIEEEGRRETWKEAVARAVEYNIGISIEELNKKRIAPPLDKIRIEAETLFDNIFNLRQFLSGRTHWVGGAKGGVADKFPLANFNCSFLNISTWSDIGDLFYLLLVGTGVGFKCTKEMAHNLAPIRDSFEVIHAPYEPIEKGQRLEDTELKVLDNGFAKVYVGDSKEGWVQSLRIFFELLTLEEYEYIHTIKISYNSIRPKGERLVTFGGTASGFEPLQEMFDGFAKVIKGELDPSLAPPERINDQYVQVRPIHILDIGNLVGNNVVVGGVRRTAEIFLSDSDDWEVILAKYGINGIWDEEKHKAVMDALDVVLINSDEINWLKALPLFDANARPLHHRRMSNNSIGFTEKPSRDMLHLIFTIMQSEGEPGFVNLEEANRRRPNAEGLNPCAEILLDSYGVCNLTTVNVDGFVRKVIEQEIETDPSTETIRYELDYSGLMQAQALSTRAGVRMTCLDLEIPHWDEVQKRDRLIGTSLTGWYDAMDKLGYNKAQENQLLSMLSEVSHVESMKYSMILRIPAPLLDTTVKPEGTLSQVAGGVSSGLHRSHSEYYIRRIRINAQDPLAKVAQELGWVVSAEVGTGGQADPIELRKPEYINQARTLVIDFPVYSGAKTTKDDVYVKEQFDTYFDFQNYYTSHNSSNTIHVRPDEWEEVEQIVWDNWNDFVGVSFLSYDGGSYALAPYEKITKEQYEELKSTMKEFTPDVLQAFEGRTLDKELALEGMDNCETTGSCPVI